MNKGKMLLAALTAALCSCGEQQTTIFDIANENVEKFNYSIGLNETINFELNSWRNNEEFVKSVDSISRKTKFKVINNEYSDYLDITPLDFSYFSIKCICEFAEDIKIDKISIEADGYCLNIDTNIELSFNNYYVANKSFPNAIYYSFPTLVDGNIQCYICFSPTAVKCSSENLIYLNSITSLDNQIKLYDCTYSFVEYTSHSIDLEYRSSEYYNASFPMKLETSKGNTYFKFLVKNNSEYETIGCDFLCEYSVDGEIIKTFVHTAISERW